MSRRHHWRIVWFFWRERLRGLVWVVAIVGPVAAFFILTRALGEDRVWHEPGTLTAVSTEAVVDGGQPRWVLRMEDGRMVETPVSVRVPFEAGATVCVRFQQQGSWPIRQSVSGRPPCPED